MSIQNKTIAITFNHAKVFLFLTFFITIGFVFLLPKIKLDSSVDAFYDKKSSNYLAFENWKEEFGTDEIIIIAFKNKELFTPNILKFISLLTKKFESLEYVYQVRSLTNVDDIIGSEDDFIVQPFAEEIPSTPSQLENLKKRALNNPLYVKDIISPDGETTALIIELEEPPDDKKDIYKKETMDKIQKILKKEFPPNQNYYLSGTTAITHFFALYMQEDLKTLMPLMFLMIFLVLFFAFRDIKKIIESLIIVILSLIWTMGFLYLCGFSINNVTTIIPPIIMALALADSVHLITEYLQRRLKNTSQNKGIVLKDTLNHLLIPCLLTTLTTMAGFASLTISQVPPVRELGIVIAVGILFTFVITFTVLSALLKFLPFSISKKSPINGKFFDKLLIKIGTLNEKKPISIIFLSLGIIVLSLWGIKKLHTETNVIEFFKKNSLIYQSTDFIETNLSGVHSLNISLKAKERDAFKQPGKLNEIEVLVNFLRNQPEVDKVTSVVDYLKEMHKSFNNEQPEYYKLPQSQKLIAQYLLISDAQDLEDFVDFDWQWTTIRIRLNIHSTLLLGKTIKKIKTYLAQHFNNVESEVTGLSVLEVDSNEAVTRGQMKSLFLAMIIIFGMMFALFRSIKIGLISIIPNVLPILINFGLMGFLGIRLNSATSMISAIGIGIIVNDTIHFLHCFGKEINKDNDYVQTMYRVLSLKGKPIIITSVILFFGFGLLATSKFLPTAYFGLLTALVMFNAVICDLIILPCFLLFFKPKFHRSIK